jgi:hypothetical protein
VRYLFVGRGHLERNKMEPTTTHTPSPPNKEEGSTAPTPLGSFLFLLFYFIDQ